MSQIDNLREATADPETFAADAFSILREVSELLAFPEGEETSARELVIQCLEHRDQVDESLAAIIDALVREAGLFPYLTSDDGLPDRDLLARESLRIEGLADPDIVLHAAQADVYARLIEGDNVVLSAPTSFGKSLIVDALLASGRYENVLVVVPTLALIDEVRRRLARRRTGHKVITHPTQPQEARNVFVFTGERVLEADLPELDLFVLDEFYKLGEPGERGEVLNQVFYEMRRDGVQYYLLGPNVEGLAESVPRELHEEFLRRDEPTVALRFHSVEQGQGRQEALVELCERLRNETLVYCQSPDSAHKTARMLLQAGVGEPEPSLQEAADWVAQNFHPDWVIVEALRHGIGVHHGQLPRALGLFIIKAFEEGRIRFLMATGTLIEGVNTHARHMVVYDKRRPGNRKMDEFTFRNISGRCGRMFHHFSGDVWLFTDPPESSLPEVDIPILSQPEEAPLSLLQHLDESDQSAGSRERLESYADQEFLSEETLRANSGIDIERQLELAKTIAEDPEEYHWALGFEQMPSYDQLALVCGLIWDHLGSGPLSSAYTTSHSQLARQLMNFQVKGSSKALIDEAVAKKSISDPDKLDELIKDVCKFVRSIAGYSFPVRLRALERIQAEVFRRHGYTPGDYAVYAAQVEGLFLDPPLVALDEYGIPPELAARLRGQLLPDGDLDAVLSRLEKLDLAGLDLTEFEVELVKYAQRGL